MKAIGRALFLFLYWSVFVVELASAQTIVGTWRGTLSVQDVKLPIAIRISHSDDGYKAVMDSPSQGAYSIAVESVKYENSMLSLGIPNLRVALSGMVRGNTYTAIFIQGGVQSPIVMVHSDDSAAIIRPQESQPPYPYRVKDVVFASLDSGVELQGTLTTPIELGRYPAVVLVTGSGTQNRDEEIMGHKPFKVIADYLTRRGIVVLRYDDRELTSKQYNGATTLNYANDALGGVAYLKGVECVNVDKIGVIGHSEGGTISFMCAAQSNDVDFIVSLAGMSVRGDECLLKQNSRSIEASGLSKELQQKMLEVVQALFEREKIEDLTKLKSSASDIVNEIIDECRANDIPAQMKQSLVKTLEDMTQWLHYFIACNPMDYISKIKCNVLALNGSKDVQVLADDNLSVLSNASNLLGKLTVKKYEGLNHMFQQCETGEVNEYGSIEQTISEEVLEDIAKWVLKQ